MAHFSAELEGMLNSKYPYLLPALKANDTGTLDDSTRIVGTLCRAHGVPMEEAIDIAAPAHFTHLWRKHRMIYVFDRDLASELLEQTARSDDGDPIPVEALLHLPYPCISIEAPPFSVLARDSDTRETVFRSDFSGRCMVTATGPEHSLGGKWPTLSVLFETQDERFSHYYLPLPDGGTLTEAYDLLLEFYESVREPGDIEYTRDIAKKGAFPVMAVAQMCLYIQAQNADLQTRPSGQGKQKKRKGVPAKRPPKVVDVGYHIGKEIRSYRVRYEPDRAGASGPSGEKRTVRPHSRRGHWHHFWRNRPEKPDEKELILRWVAPTFIHPDGGDDKPTVVKAKK